MITENMIPEIKKRVGVNGWNNEIFQKYLKSEMRPIHTCPICNLVLGEYKLLHTHLHKKHESRLNDPAVVKALDPLGRIKDIIEDKKDPTIIGLGQLFADIITSEHNKHVLLTLIGKTGMGKSYAAMRIGEEVSRCVANLKGGTANDYFNINNIAIMRLDSIIPIIKDLDQRRYNIIILDDIGASYSARDFNKSINKNINKIFQTFRDTNTMVVLTVPDQMLIDKTARRLAHYQIEIIEARHNQGVSIGKLFEVKDQYRLNGKVYYYYVQYGGVKYTRVVFKRASDGIIAEYDKKRKEIRKTLMADSIEAIMQSEEGIGSKEAKPEKAHKHIKIAESVVKLMNEDPKITDTQLSLQLSTTRFTIRKAKQYLKENGGL